MDTFKFTRRFAIVGVSTPRYLVQKVLDTHDPAAVKQHIDHWTRNGVCIMQVFVEFDTRKAAYAYLHRKEMKAA